MGKITDTKVFDAIETIIRAGLETEAIKLLLDSVERKNENMRVAYGEFKAEKRAIVSILKHGDSSNKSKVQTVIDFFDEGGDP